MATTGKRSGLLQRVESTLPQLNLFQLGYNTSVFSSPHPILMRLIHPEPLLESRSTFTTLLFAFEPRVNVTFSVFVSSSVPRHLSCHKLHPLHPLPLLFFFCINLKSSHYLLQKFTNTCLFFFFFFVHLKMENITRPY